MLVIIVLTDTLKMEEEDIAIIYDSAMCEKVRKISYLELKKDVAELAGALKEKGIKKGDRVIIYMPMIPRSCSSHASVRQAWSYPFSGFWRLLLQ